MTGKLTNRTHYCTDLRQTNVGNQVKLTGWVNRRRDHGNLIFIDLRDRTGIIQLRFDRDSNEHSYQIAKKLRNEFVIAVEGTVIPRPEGMINDKMLTGAIEIQVQKLAILNEAETTPFLISDDAEVSEDLLFKYRYLDLRRPKVQKNMMFRHQIYQITRKFFADNGFIEIETPFLTKSTPEGARDFLVPSRVIQGRFYALPQSPQIYKQLLMLAGFDRYFQIVRCFRDEDLRADRQLEFTQIDVEMSFVEEFDILNIIELFMQTLVKETLDQDLQLPLPRISFEDSMNYYGNDKPDLRFGMKIVNVNNVLANTDFNLFSSTIKSGGLVAGICLAQGSDYSRKQVDNLTDYVKTLGARGLIAIKVRENDWDSNISKLVPAECRQAVLQAMNANNGDLLLLVADNHEVTRSVLGNLRLYLAETHHLLDPKSIKLAWVVDFPLFEYSKEEQRYVARHHPFTAPVLEDLPLLESAPEKVRARAYDLVLNGQEIAGGSIRIHDAALQRRMFRALKISDEEAEAKFGFLINAFQYGAPPHGGIAFGFDRLVSLLAGKDSIRDVIAFPKTTGCLSPMDGSPSEVAPFQLAELGIQLLKVQEIG